MCLINSLLACETGEACCHFAPPRRARVGLIMKGGMEMRTIQRFIAKTCIFLFILVSASKFLKLLITSNEINIKLPSPIGEGLGVRSTNQFPREFDSNVRIATFEHLPASSHPRQKTNFSKRELLSFCFCSLPQRFGEGLGMGVLADTATCVTSRRRPLFSPPCEALRGRH
jgi:hypothetical protein